MDVLEVAFDATEYLATVLSMCVDFSICLAASAAPGTRRNLWFKSTEILGTAAVYQRRHGDWGPRWCPRTIGPSLTACTSISATVPAATLASWDCPAVRKGVQPSESDGLDLANSPRLLGPFWRVGL